MKKLVSVLLCLALVAAMAVTAFADGSVEFTISGPSGDLSRGDTITLDVSVSSTAVAYSYGMKFEYDTDVFELVSGRCTVPGTQLSSFRNGFAFMFPAQNEAGEPVDPIAYSGVVGTATFKVKEDAPGGTWSIVGVASVKNGSATVPASANSVSFNVVVPCDHNFGEWDPAQNGNGHEQVCELCGSVNSAAHDWDDGVVVTPADCENDGEMLYTCETCGAEESEQIPTLGHDWNDGEVVTPAGCETEGELLCTCEACGTEQTEVIPAAGHSYGSWTTTVAPTTESTGERQRVCNVCGYTQTEVVPAVSSPATGDTQLILWTTLMAISACGVAAIAFFSTKKKETI